MTGKSHKAIGTAVGAAFAIYGIGQGNAVYALGMVSAPLAAMLPDIDHGSARIGRIRKMAANIIVTALAVAIVAGAWIHGHFFLENYATLLMVGLGVVVPTVFMFRLSQTRWVRDTWGFVAKHRGIMHTLIIPIFTLVATFYIRDRYALILVYGFLAGYVSHILADCLTTKGCPILFPASKQNIKFTKVKTGSSAERVCAMAMIIVVLVIAVLVSF